MSNEELRMRVIVTSSFFILHSTFVIQSKSTR